MKGTRNENSSASAYGDEDSEEYSYSDGERNEAEDEMATVSFGALSAAQKQLEAERNRRRKGGKSGRSHRDDGSSDSESDSESDSAPSEQEYKKEYRENRGPRWGDREAAIKRRSKHAPAVASSKQPVSKVREIPGLETKKSSSMYSDIRFNAAYGKADLKQARKNYAFLDEYRAKEINEMQSVLKDKKTAHLLSEHEKEEVKLRIQSLKSRLDTLKNRDLEDEILSKHKKETIQRVKDGKQSNPYFLKKSEKRKMIQKAKFESMKGSQREKVMERKRKRRLGKEFKALEFNQR